MAHDAWRSLGGTGTHEESIYIEGERAEVRSQFAQAPRRVLDIGCARGNVGLGLKKEYGDDVFVWGVELTPSSVEVALTRLDKVTAYPVEQFTAQELELLKTMDTVMLLDVLEHMYNPWQTLVFLSQHLSPDAQIIVSLPNVMHISVMRDIAEGYFGYKKSGLLDVTHIRFFTPYDMKRMAYQTGFRVESQLFMMAALGEEQTRCQSGPFPIWMQVDKIKIEVQSYEHWLQLSTFQSFMRWRIAPDETLQDWEANLRHDDYPPTMVFAA